jgi:membrane protein DedA with SNARE-associated domain
LRLAILTLFGVVTVASLFGTALAPYLLVKSPLLLVGISPGAPHVALAAATVEPESLITVASLRRALTSVATFGLGMLYGPAVVTYVEERHPRLTRLVKFFERLFARWGMIVLLVAPLPALAMLAGAARARFWTFLGAVLAGHVFWNTLTYHVGDALGRFTDQLTEFLRHHLLESTLVCIALVALQQLYARLRAPKADSGE